jgi:hypothetical protein
MDITAITARANRIISTFLFVQKLRIFASESNSANDFSVIMHQHHYECGKKANTRDRVASGRARVGEVSRFPIITWKDPGEPPMHSHRLKLYFSNVSPCYPTFCAIRIFIIHKAPHQCAKRDKALTHS